MATCLFYIKIIIIYKIYNTKCIIITDLLLKNLLFNVIIYLEGDNIE